MNDIMKNNFDNTSWIKKNSRYLIVIFLYLLYQFNFIPELLRNFGFNIESLSRVIRIVALMTNDLVYVLILLLMFKKEIKIGLKDLKNHFVDRALTSINCWIVGCLVMIASSFIISKLIGQQVSTNEALVRKGIQIAPFYMLFTCAIIAPILEEMVFRVSFRGLIKNNFLFVFVSGFIFGLLHVIGNFSSPMDFLYIIPYGSMGCAFAYLLVKTDNITLSIILHMIHNTVLVLAQIMKL